MLTASLIVIAQQQSSDGSQFMALFGCFFYCFIPVSLLLAGLIMGTMNERRHLADLDRREAAVRHFVVTDLKTFPGGALPKATPFLVTGETVIASDTLKTLLGNLRNLIGGRVTAFESLLERARRESILRMIETANQHGYNALANVRVETIDAGSLNRNKGTVAVGVVASATAYYIDRTPAPEALPVEPQGVPAPASDT